MTEQGLIQELDFPEGRARFDSCVEPHVNLTCLQCGNIQDMDDPAAREIVANITARTEFTRTGQRLDIYGVCKTCRNKPR